MLPSSHMTLAHAYLRASAALKGRAPLAPTNAIIASGPGCANNPHVSQLAHPSSQFPYRASDGAFALIRACPVAPNGVEQGKETFPSAFTSAFTSSERSETGG